MCEATHRALSDTQQSSASIHCQRNPPAPGGTRFIGVYLARQLVAAGHHVTLLTRGKSPVTQQIPDDTDESFKAYEAAVNHIACDRKDPEALKQLAGKGFQGEMKLGLLIVSMNYTDDAIYSRKLWWEIDFTEYQPPGLLPSEYTTLRTSPQSQ